MNLETDTHGEAPPNGAPHEPAAAPDAGAILGGVLAELRGFVASLAAVARLEWQRLQLRAIDSLLTFALFAVVLVVALAAAATAGVVLVAGVRDGLARWTGAVWAGELGAGLVVLFVLVCAGSLVRSLVRRRRVAAAVRPPPPEAGTDTETETETS